jgi:hypothetical protein
VSDGSPTLFTDRYAERAEQLFLRPGCQYGWDEIVVGVAVRRQDGSYDRMAAVDRNTFRGFHRVSKELPGAGEPFRRYFAEQRLPLVDELLTVSDRDSLHGLSNRISNEVRAGLSNIKPDQLASYNKVRKPIDLYLEHLAAMSFELENHRQVLVPLLFLPLDCQILESPELFTERELAQHGLRRSSTYSEVTTEAAYLSLQQVVSRRAGEVSRTLSQPFWPIYFDLLWNNRHSNWGSNLFEANP